MPGQRETKPRKAAPHKCFKLPEGVTLSELACESLCMYSAFLINALLSFLPSVSLSNFFFQGRQELGPRLQPQLLAVQWLGLDALAAATRFPSLVRERKPHCKLPLSAVSVQNQSFQITSSLSHPSPSNCLKEITHSPPFSHHLHQLTLPPGFYTHPSSETASAKGHHHLLVGQLTHGLFLVLTLIALSAAFSLADHAFLMSPGF